MLKQNMRDGGRCITVKTINHSRGPENGCLAAANNIPRMRVCARVCRSKASAGRIAELLFSAASAEPEAFLNLLLFFPLVVRDGEHSRVYLFFFFFPSSLVLNFLITHTARSARVCRFLCSCSLTRLRSFRIPGLKCVMREIMDSSPGERCTKTRRTSVVAC